jgi:hypothetical protein
MYEKGTMRPVETILRGRGRRGIKVNDEGVNLTKIYCKHCYNVTVYPSTIII